MRLRLTLMTLLVVASSGHAADDPRPEVWLDDMNRAFRDLNYDGVFSYFTGTDVASLRVVHMVIGGEQRERLVHLNGAPREIVRKGDDVACILLPGDKLLELEGSIPSGPFARAFVRRFDRISGHYALSYSGEDRIAGRDAYRIAVSPKDQDRYGYRLWLDKEYHLLLRSDLVDVNGARLEIFQFTHVTIGDAVKAVSLRAEEPDGSLVTHLTLANDVSAPIAMRDVRWHARWLPSGFRMTTADIRRTPSKLKTVDTMMYSDGLAVFSVFVEDMPELGAAAMVSRNGATVAVTHFVPGPDQKNALVTLVGEVPEDTAWRIAKSIYYQPSP